jgi:DNA polymerase (family X)
VRIVIDSDAHRVSTLANMRWGVTTARRAWLTSAQVANTRSLSELRCAGGARGSREQAR